MDWASADGQKDKESKTVATADMSMIFPQKFDLSRVYPKCRIPDDRKAVL
jgi:hypothetical protein